MKTYRYLDLITAAFVAVLIISNVAATKVVVLGPFTFDGGTLLFPLAYIFGDVLTEVYGYARSRRVIWTGFALLALASLTFSAVAALPALADPEVAPFARAFDLLFGLVPRIVLGSLLAYWAGEFANSYVLARMKVWSRGRSFGLRAPFALAAAWLWIRLGDPGAAARGRWAGFAGVREVGGRG